MAHSSLYLAAIAVSALEDVEIVATRPPFEETPDYLLGALWTLRAGTGL
ncbi:hypothetical protein [Flaviflexus ciconiae]|nr:hypothetical protein [Flaviflexus ciconiae]